MKLNSLSMKLFSSTLLLVFSMQIYAEPADETGFVNSITEGGSCGQGMAGELQYLQNSDQSNAYKVTVKTTVMREGKKKDTSKTLSIKAGGKKHLGCSFSDTMPLASYERVIVSETKSP